MIKSRIKAQPWNTLNSHGYLTCFIPVHDTPNKYAILGVCVCVHVKIFKKQYVACRSLVANWGWQPVYITLSFPIRVSFLYCKCCICKITIISHLLAKPMYIFMVSKGCQFLGWQLSNISLHYCMSICNLHIYFDKTSTKILVNQNFICIMLSIDMNKKVRVELI